MEEFLRSVGIPFALLVIGMMFLSILTIASGVGMWMGTKWGWWLASFYYVYSIFRNGSALFTVVTMADQLEGSARGPEYYMTKHGVRIVIHCLLVFYFFKPNVLEFFDMASVNKARAVGVLVGICTGLAVAMSVFGLAVD
ncbi:hypothetical protein [Stieleria mannarensis]|uniref:hypothetical protein n=1 Tax=Stieleria mannarensis TaxID=2755585 RepID=UPI0015FF8265|nr:hypothetical protein [Rhodopirellula sp. JC639]